ncbi:MAG: Wzy polymerase domain-containing protein [Pseudorhodoferax sp.]
MSRRTFVPAIPMAELWRMNLRACVFGLCTLPWLNPFSLGPIASVVPWLFSALAAALAVGASARLAEPGPQSLWQHWWYLGGAAALLIFALLPRSTVLPPYEAFALAGAFGLIALGIVLARQPPSPRDIDGMPWAGWCALLPWTVAGLVSCFLGLLQYFGQAGAFAPWVNWAPSGEAFANLRQRNQFASLTSIALATLLAAWVLAPRQCKRAQSVWLGGAAALLIAGNAASASRTGLLQLLVLIAAALVWRRDLRTLSWLGCMFMCYVLATLALPWLAGLDPDSHGMFSRLRDGDALCSSRLTLWHNVLQLIAAKPWLGWGWGELDYAHYITLYEGPRFCDILDNAHNLPLHLAVELGIPAALLVCGGLVVWVLRAKPWRETDALRRAAWMVLAVIGVHSLLEYPLWYGPFQIALGLCLGLLWRDDPAATPAAAAVRHAPTLLAVLSLALVAYAAWDYRRISQLYLPPAQRAPAYRDDTLAKAQQSWLYQRQVRFAALGMAEVTQDNAAFMHALATELLHFSPEPRVIEKLLDSARLLGLQDEVAFHKPRFAAAFPNDYARWLAAQPADPPAR